MSNRVLSSQARRTLQRTRTALGTAVMVAAIGWQIPASAQPPLSPPSSLPTSSQDTTLRVLEASDVPMEKPSAEIWIDSSPAPTSKASQGTQIRIAPVQPARSNTPAHVASPPTTPARPAASMNRPAPALVISSHPSPATSVQVPSPPAVAAAPAEAKSFTGEFIPAPAASPRVPQVPVTPSPRTSAETSEAYSSLIARLTPVPVTSDPAAATPAPSAPATPVVTPSAPAPAAQSVVAPSDPAPAAKPVVVAPAARPAAPVVTTAPVFATGVMPTAATANAPESPKTAERIEPTPSSTVFPSSIGGQERSLVDLAADLQAIQPSDVPHLARVPSDSQTPTLAPPQHPNAILAQKPPITPTPMAQEPQATVEPPLTPTPMAEPGKQMGPFEVIDSSDEMKVIVRRSKLLRTRSDIFRTAVVDPSVCDIVQFTPREISVIGKREGATDVTFWFNDETHRPMTFLVRVTADPDLQQRREEQYGVLQDYLAELFPNSKVTLTPVADKLLVRGQARDAAEAAQILSIIRGQAVMGGPYFNNGTAAPPLPQDNVNNQIPATQVINMLRIPGVQQVSLRVKIAELNRSAARNFGVDMNLNFNDGKVILRSMVDAFLQSTPTVLGSFDNGDLEFGIHYLEKHGVVRMLSEPTLITLSGHPATFIAGGEFAVPTTVGVSGASAVTTDFRAYGAIIEFLPTVLDKDNIRLDVSPEFSQINNDLKVNGTPGLNTRAVTTTLELRAGQTLAIAGLLDDSMKGENTGDLPIIWQIFGKRQMTRNETELLILVTPELVHPMEPEEVPPLPGFDVTEPNNCEFFLGGKLEGTPTQDYRSTVWPMLRERYQHGGPAMISGPFGHGN